VANWRTNFYLANRANNLADAMLTMLNNATGDSSNVPGMDPRTNGEDVIRNSLITDAEYFMSMDPARLEDEFNSQIRAANLSTNAEAKANLDLAQATLNPTVWHGVAAKKFHKQISYATTFMDQQGAQATFAAQAAGMMLAVSVQFRESFYSLVDTTIAVCNAKIARTPVSSDLNWKSILIDIVGELKDLVTGKTIADLASWTIDTMLKATSKFTEEPPVDGEPAQIVDGYVNARNLLVRSYEDNVGSIQSWVSARRGELAGLTMPLLEPLPRTTDVDSPDFRYENFAYVEPVPGVDNASVERERTQYAEEKSKPHRLIGARLDGAEGPR
jgi:hypothetical protein